MPEAGKVCNIELLKKYPFWAPILLRCAKERTEFQNVCRVLQENGNQMKLTDLAVVMTKNYEPLRVETVRHFLKITD